MYTELVEGESGNVEPQSNSVTAVGIKKLLIDVSYVNHYVTWFIHVA